MDSSSWFLADWFVSDSRVSAVCQLSDFCYGGLLSPCAYRYLCWILNCRWSFQVNGKVSVLNLCLCHCSLSLVNGGWSYTMGSRGQPLGLVATLILVMSDFHQTLLVGYWSQQLLMSNCGYVLIKAGYDVKTVASCGGEWSVTMVIFWFLGNCHSSLTVLNVDACCQPLVVDNWIVTVFCRMFEISVRSSCANSYM